VIGLTQNIHSVSDTLNGINSSPGLGAYGHLQIPIDMMSKQATTEEDQKHALLKNLKEIEQELK
jgi:hypothetical protein